MTVLETLRNTMNSAVDTIQSVTQTVIEKNRTNAKLNRLRFIMKNESELMNRAYIALGKQCYEKQKTGVSVSSESQEKLISVIDASKSKLVKARECYKKIMDSQNDVFGEKTEAPKEKADAAEIVDITVACSNENEYDSSPFAAEQSDEPEVNTTEADNAEAEDNNSEHEAKAADSEESDEELF